MYSSDARVMEIVDLLDDVVPQNCGHQYLWRRGRSVHQYWFATVVEYVNFETWSFAESCNVWTGCLLVRELLERNWRRQSI